MSQSMVVKKRTSGEAEKHINVYSPKMNNAAVVIQKCAIYLTLAFATVDYIRLSRYRHMRSWLLRKRLSQSVGEQTAAQLTALWARRSKRINRKKV